MLTIKEFSIGRCGVSCFDTLPPEFSKKSDPFCLKISLLIVLCNTYLGTAAAPPTASAQPVITEHIAAIEAQLNKDPLDTVRRIELIEYYWNATRSTLPRARDKYWEHLMILVRTDPANACFEDLRCQPDHFISPNSLDSSWKEWEAQCLADPTNALIVKHAALFFRFTDSIKSRKLLTKGAQLDPNNWFWTYQLSYMDWVKYGLLRKEVPTEYDRAEMWVNFDNAIRLSQGESTNEILVMGGRLAVVLCEHVRAQDYVTRVPVDESTRKERPDIYYWVNIVKGEVALAKGLMEVASEFLMRAADLQGVDPTRPFSADLVLAEKLLVIGQEEVVIGYLEKCSRLWPTLAPRAVKLIQQIENGEEVQLTEGGRLNVIN